MSKKNKVCEYKKARHLVFLILTISLILSSVPLVSKDLNFLPPKAAEYNGSKNINISLNETQYIVYDKINISQPAALSVQFSEWNSEKFEIEVVNITENKIENWTIQDVANPETEKIIPVYGNKHEYNYGEHTIIYKPQELGTNFTLKNPSYIQYLYLRLGFNIGYKEDFNNLNETRYMINNASVDIRQDNGSNAPLQNENVKSIPLCNCTVVWDYKNNTDHIGKTIGYAIDEKPKDGMLSYVIIQVPVNTSILQGNYWTVFNSTVVHELNQPDYISWFRIQVYSYNDGTNNSYYVNRTYDSNYYASEFANIFNDPMYDIYHIIEKKNTDYVDPTEIDFRIDNFPINASKRLEIFSSVYSGKSFTYSKSVPENIHFSAMINATVNRATTRQPSVSFQSLENGTVKWNGSLPLFTPHAKCHNKNTTFTIPNNWDVSRLQLYDDLNDPLVFTASGHEITVLNTENIAEIRFEITTDNVITTITTFDDTVSIPSSLNVTCEGVGTGNYLKLDLYCNGTLVKQLATGTMLNDPHSFTLSYDVPEGGGYSVRAYWDNGEQIGYIESNVFAIMHIPDLTSVTPYLYPINSTTHLNGVGLVWDSVEYATYYKIYRSPNPILEIDGMTPFVSEINETVYNDTNVFEGETYRYVIVACNNVSESKISNYESVTIPSENDGEGDDPEIPPPDSDDPNTDDDPNGDGNNNSDNSNNNGFVMPPSMLGAIIAVLSIMGLGWVYNNKKKKIPKLYKNVPKLSDEDEDEDEKDYWL